MNKYFKGLLVSLFLIAFGGLALTQDDDDVVKITSNLVQLDAVVVDKDGKQVTDLKAEDFRIFQDGKEQKITAFSYVPIGNPQSTNASPVGASVSSSNTRTGRGRVITFVVDDGNCRVTVAGIRATRDALQKFVTEQMLPDDQVAIYRTRSGSSLFQHYTSDKAHLLRVIAKLRWYPVGMGCGFNDGQYFETARVNTTSIPTVSGLQTSSEESEVSRLDRELSEDRSSSDQVSDGTFGVITYALRGLERLPGRKVMFLMSDGIQIRARNGLLLDGIDHFRDITERANRAAVVINTVDTRGLINVDMIEARDNAATLGDPLATEAIVDRRRSEMTSSQDGLAFIADETGGRFYKGQDYLDGPLRKALSAERGFYLVAYEPDDDTFKGKKFNKIEIRVTRPGLKVLSRTGFASVVDKPVKPSTKTGDSQLYDAIVAPLPTAGLELGLTSFYGNSTSEGNFIRSSVHISGSGLSFTDEPGGMKKAVVDVVAVTMDEKNRVVDEFTHQHVLKVPATSLAVIEKNGLLYAADVKVQKPGIYNYRVALRDVNSKRIGSVSQVIEVPELKRNRLFLSGLTATAVDASGKFSTLAKATPNSAFSIPTTQSGPAIRNFRRGSVIAYPYVIYNAKVAQGGKPNLTVETNLYLDGKLVIDGKPQPAELTTAQKDWTRIDDFGYIRLNPKIAPGVYVLEVIVTDLARGKDATSSQTTDFQIVE